MLTLYVHDGSVNGQLLQGAQVSGNDADNNSFNQTTNSSGFITITGTPGMWQFNASGSGYDNNNWAQIITATDRKDAFLIKSAPQSSFQSTSSSTLSNQNPSNLTPQQDQKSSTAEELRKTINSRITQKLNTPYLPDPQLFWEVWQYGAGASLQRYRSRFNGQI